MKELVEHIARALVDHPEDVQVTVVEGPQSAVLELRVHAGRPWQSDWQTGPHGKSDSHDPLRQRDEAPQTLHP